ncbi:MAG: TonB-dependent receptor [Rhizobacter sp.]|nr:TonB-dependent receptor [Ferruginibacter sp.]
MQKHFLFFFLLITGQVLAQEAITLQVKTDKRQNASGSSIELRKVADSSLFRTGLTDAGGIAVFQNVPGGNYFFKIMHTGSETLITKAYHFPGDGLQLQQVLKTTAQTLQSVTVQSRKPFIQQLQGKTIVNVDAMISNAGTTVLELLEKSPGVLVDRNGGVSLQNKAGVLVLIDDKSTYLSGVDLTNMLNSMSSSQVEQIELITNPSAKYDAAGNAGIINIKTKKNRQRGFNGNFTVSAGHGRHHKNNNSLVMNYRNGKYNAFLTWSSNYSKFYTDMYALRTYFKAGGGDSSRLDQPTSFKTYFNNNTVKTGLDYFLTNKTTVGITLTASLTNRDGTSDAMATWLDETNKVDSAIHTTSKTTYDLKNGNISAYTKHAFNKKNEFSIEADWLNYDIVNDQLFTNERALPQYYYEGTRGDLPAKLKILSAKADYIWKFTKDAQMDAGIKAANTKTNNLANYSFSNGGAWERDLGKTNHFLYDEKIYAAYTSVQQKFTKWSYQAGLRLENTTYTATQLGHGIRPDSSFDNDYTSLFPSGFISFDADSNNSITVTVSRRLDRPPFQKLNPFTFTINKYTYEKGNPFTRPQFSWNIELSHLFKQKITTTLSYSFIKDYYSQVFQRDNNNIMIYTTGNVGEAYNVGASVAAQINVNKWWFFTAQALYNYKKLKGYVWNDYHSDVHQFNFSMNNQFKIGKVYTAELSGFYTGRARNDLQEILYPISQVVVAAARPVLKKKGTLKLSFRDIFHKNGMEGLTDFENSKEYFWLKRDSRVATLSFTYRFGEPFKALNRSSGSAADEMQRVGS